MSSMRDDVTMGFGDPTRATSTTVIAAPTIVKQDSRFHGVEVYEFRQQLGRGVL